MATNTTVATEVRAYINRVLEEGEYSLTGLARLAGVSATTLTRFMNADNHAFNLSTTTLAKIAQATGIAYTASPGTGSTLAQRIKDARKRASMSQAELAYQMRVTRGAAGQWESGETTPSASNLIEIANILGVGVEWLATGRNDAGGAKSGEDKTLEAMRIVRGMMALPEWQNKPDALSALSVASLSIDLGRPLQTEEIRRVLRAIDDFQTRSLSNETRGGDEK